MNGRRERHDTDWSRWVFAGVCALLSTSAHAAPAEEGPAVEIVASDGGRDVAARIRALADGGSNDWDAAVRVVLRDAYDADESGIVDQDVEVSAIPCDTWLAIDDGVRHRWPSGLYLTYGIDPELIWIGDALGLDRLVRDGVVAALRSCSVQGSQAEVARPRDAALLGRALGMLPKAGGAAWSHVVRTTLVRAYDADRSGDLDRTEEVRAVGCALWEALDGALARDGAGGLYGGLGFDPDAPWRGWLVGVEGPMRAIAADAILGCGLGPAGGAAPVAGTNARDSRVVDILLAFDADGSGWLDRAEEINAVPCTPWVRLQARTSAAHGLDAVEIYGLRPGRLWTGDTAGITASARGATLRAVRRCGLVPDRRGHRVD